MSIAGSIKPTAKLYQIKLDWAKSKGGQGIDLSKKYRLKWIMWDTWCKLYFTSRYFPLRIVQQVTISIDINRI